MLQENVQQEKRFELQTLRVNVLLFMRPEAPGSYFEQETSTKSLREDPKSEFNDKSLQDLS